jgi:uncharacterized membrane protein YhfC
MPSNPSPLLLLSGAGMMAIGAAAVLLYRRGRSVSWTVFGLGALAWIISVALKFAWAAPMNSRVKAGLDAMLPATAADPSYWLYIGLLTGVFECGFTLLFVKRTRLKAADWDAAVAFGIGFGAIEAFLLGLLSFIGLLIVIVFWDQLPEDTRTAAANRVSGKLVAIPLPVAERVSALVAHVFTCVLIVYAVRIGESRWFWISFAYKSLLDAFAALGILATNLASSTRTLAAFEAAVGVFALVGLAGLVFVRKRYPSPHGTASPQSP